ncbi:MAG: hypothetical protein AAFN70_05860, partial [Planctomycetota bacterium]
FPMAIRIEYILGSRRRFEAGVPAGYANQSMHESFFAASMAILRQRSKPLRNRNQSSANHVIVDFPSLGEAVINNDTGLPKERPSIETRLLLCLRTWQVTPDVTVDDGRTLFQEICGLLEFFICGCIPYGPNNLGGWWSDGVIHLEITNPELHRFNLLGVTWIDSLGIAPFEIDLELDPNDQKYFAKTIFRIGILDHYGRPTVCNRNLASARVLANRPRYNRDWAMAVELTPPAQHAERPNDASEPPS